MKYFLSFICIFSVFVQCTQSQDLSSQEVNQLNQEIKAQLFPGTENKDIKFNFDQSFKEVLIPISDGINLSGLYFNATNPKGLIFYLHGSNADLSEWGKISTIYTNLNYDLFMIDYRGYGKSDGKFLSERQWYNDMQIVFEYLKKEYAPESKITIIGQSLGTAAASYLAAKNSPNKVILQAPFYSFADWTASLDSNINLNVLELKLDNYQNLKETKGPIIIFHGNQDKAVYYGSSLKLMDIFKKGDKMITLEGEGHNDFSKNLQYLKELKKHL